MQVQWVATAAIAAGVAVPALAGVTYTSQTRTVRAAAGIPTVSLMHTAPDFGVYADFVEIYGPNPDMQPDSYGQASQLSALTDTRLTMTGSAGGYDSYGFGGAGGGGGQSELNVTFDAVGVPWWELYATTDGFSLTTSITVILERLSPEPAVLFRGTTFDTQPFSGGGTLPDGTYRFQARFRGGYGGTGTGSSTLNYDLSLTVPGPGSAAVLGVAGLMTARRRRV